ncbi:PREDICTED: uncharacterized protein LOC108754099 isoform X2 [Trachymyrmex septentrionalis]|uniref:uncharacterized protein LOC108754099 isoform X2 n=1 Tax=Trachymyrmex septentrionalis TaxID=34720 RepID=UPI00084F611A|nr:PREDICTED: uncharacterized protein LOC108754099 isoform X2 [Trachymyrmex septentrionalis]
MKKLLSFRWIKKTTRLDRDVQSSPPMPQDGRNEYCRNLLQQFANHCQTSNGEITDPDWVVYLSKEQNAEQSALKDNRKLEIHGHFIPGVPHIRAAEIFEIGCISGTENKCLELVSAEWNNTKVTLKRHVLSTCRDAIKADVEILNEIRHPNILLLMATTYTSEHGLVSIFESIDCSLYNYMHEQGERINVQGIMQIGIKLADALKYCHMRGYIHTAISSHCVYFATDTTVKLGGWELAREIEKTYVERNFEKYLRLENFKWQAPAICYRLQPNKKMDVYCLMLLLWEMCTGNVPWSGYDQSNVERQHMARKRDIVINLQNVPSILRSLLEAGLHPDETMIMLDMDRIGKKLHRLLMIYEEEKNDTFINENRNNNDLLYNDTLYQKTSSMSLMQNKVLTKKPFTGQSCQPMGEKKSMSNQLLKSKKEQCNGDLDSKNNMKKMTVINDIVVSPMVETTTPCTRCAEISNIVQDLDERNNARANIKRLKKLIASRREDFFFGSDSTFSYSTSYPKATSSLLSQEKSPDYVPCKPANHTTAIEPKCNKSPSEYKAPSGAISKLCTPRRKAPYTGMPSSIKYAIMQPQVLHSNAKSFYESTLWRKEKEICLSRMGRNSKEYSEDSLLSQQTICCNTSITDDDKVQYSTPHVKNADTTYIIGIEKGNYTEDNKESLKNVSDSISANISITSNQSIQNLKNALDRATEIISSTTPSKVNLNLSMDEVKNIKTVNEATGEHEQIFNQAFMDSKTLSSTTTKTSIESETSQNQQSTKKTDQSKIRFANRDTSTPQKIRVDEREYVNIRPMNSVILKDSPRRRSLPAKLNNLTTYASPRTVLNKKNIQGNQYTTEDMYIDDEFGSKLNYNLILLNDSIILSDDDESLPQTTEL